MQISVDIGSSHTKIYHGGERHIFPSLVGVVAKKPYAIGEEEYVEYKGKSYAIGATARAVLPPNERVNSLHPQWAFTDGWLALLLASIAKVIKANSYEGDVALCTGLPQKFYDEDKDGLIVRVAGEHQFTHLGRNFRIKIPKSKLIVMPQVMGLYCKQNASNALAQGRHAYWDFGSYTTGVAVIEDGAYKSWECLGGEVGASNIASLFGQYLMDKYGFRANPETLIQCLHTGKLVMADHTLDVRPLVTQLARTIITPLVNEAVEKWGGGHDMAQWIGGGAGCLFYQPVSERFTQSQLLTSSEDAIYAVVEGYAAYQKAKLRAPTKREKSNVR